MKLSGVKSAIITGPELFMENMLEVQSDSNSALCELEQYLANITVHQFPGENVKECAQAINTICQHLERANRLPLDNTWTVVGIYLECSVERFRQALYNLQVSLSSMQQSTTKLI